MKMASSSAVGSAAARDLGAPNNNSTGQIRRSRFIRRGQLNKSSNGLPRGFVLSRAGVFAACANFPSDRSGTRVPPVSFCSTSSHRDTHGRDASRDARATTSLVVAMPLWASVVRSSRSPDTPRVGAVRRRASSVAVDKFNLEGELAEEVGQLHSRPLLGVRLNPIVTGGDA